MQKPEIIKSIPKNPKNFGKERYAGIKKQEGKL
jgi:hypothetical protein